MWVLVAIALPLPDDDGWSLSLPKANMSSRRSGVADSSWAVASRK